MAKRQVFYSFHFDNDVMRVQQVRNIGALEDNKPCSVNDWEAVKRGGDVAIKKWIDDNMKYRSCVVVLIGEKTADRKWVRHEIVKAWNDKRGLLGVYIHNINCLRNGKCSKGPNPFDLIEFTDGTKMSTRVTCYDPSPVNAYGDIAANLGSWVEKATSDRK